MSWWVDMDKWDLIEIIVGGCTGVGSIGIELKWMKSTEVKMHQVSFRDNKWIITFTGNIGQLNWEKEK